MTLFAEAGCPPFKCPRFAVGAACAASKPGFIIECTDGHVIELNLSPNPVGGRIASQIGLLTRLEVLSLADMQLIGRVPSDVGLLTALQSLGLQYNKLGGTLPGELVHLTHLDVL